MKRGPKAPWYKYYDGEKEHLEYPDFSVYKLIEYTASKHLNNISYDYYGTKKTYHEFLKQIDEAARALKALGVKHKDVVSICMPNAPEAIIAFYACNKIGAVASMIHPLSAENEIKYYLNLSKSSFLIIADFAFNKAFNILDDTKVKKVITVSLADSMPVYMIPIYYATKGIKIRMKHSDKRITWKEFIKLGNSYTKEMDDNFRGKDIAAILYSGGTTGTPKGVVLTNLNLNAQAMQSFEHVACLRGKDRLLAILPIFHGYGLAICVHTCQYVGGTSVLLPQFNAKTFDKVLLKYKPNVVAGVPTLYEAIISNKKLEHADLSFITCVLCGGDSLSPELKKRVDKFLADHGSKTVIREGYGLTECGSASCLNPVNHCRDGSIGIPYPDTYFKIVEAGTEIEVPYGTEGEIVISGPTVMQGYVKNRKETRQTLRKHRDGRVWLHTGDQGYMDEDGYVFFKGRLKRMIVSSGYCVYPAQIENVIDSHPDVLTSCVIGIDHPYKVQVAKAFIVLKDYSKANEETLNSIKELVEKNLSRFSWPYDYEFRAELPKTLVGKIAYNVLIHEEEMKKHNRPWEKSEELLEQVEDESSSDELLDNLKGE
jgi:long-chain acyl-CoA synthetase